MSIPVIYCSKKIALPDEEITLIASFGTGVWEFPNSVIGTDIIIDDGELDESTITFHATKSIDPLLINIKVIVNIVLNGADWDDTGARGLGDYWDSPSTQENLILTGWNFQDKSQRVNQTTSNNPYISQDNLIVSGGEYKVELEYRATKDVEVVVGGHTFELSATPEGEPFAIYPILHGSGLVEFETTNGGNVKWVLADGTVQRGLSVSKTLDAGTSYLIMNNFVGQSIGSSLTNTNYIGALSDIPSGLSIIELDNTLVQGNIGELNHIQDVISIINNNLIYGDIASLSGISSIVNLSGCGSISGDIAIFTGTDQIILDGTNVFGTITVSSDGTNWSLNNTLLSKIELEDSLVNLADHAVAFDVEYGYFECYDNMPTVNSPSACAALQILRNKFWTINVHESCVYGN